MANVNGLKGLSLATGANTLIAAYGNDFINLATGNGYGKVLTSNQNVEFESFLQSLFFQNYTETPLSFDGTVWSRQHCGKVPLAKYIKKFNDRLFLGYVKVAGVEYPSRCWYSDLAKNNTITWGYETGTNLSTIANNPLVSSANAGFKGYNIKRGDPFYITSGSDQGEYRVQSISDDQQIVLTQPMTTTASGISYWCGGNWFDVARDDADFVTWLGDNNFFFTPQMLIFKRDSLHRYDGQRRVQVQGAVGTTSGRSVINMHELTIYFHGSSGILTGFYAYDGREAVKISAPIENHIAGINSGAYTSIVSWRERDLYRAYVGNIVNNDKGINILGAVVTWDYNAKAWSIDPINDVITVATDFRQAGIKQVYLGTNADKILITPSGNDFNGASIPWSFDSTVYYPAGTQVINTFTRVQIFHENAEGVTVKYQLHLTPFKSDDNFDGLGSLTGERTEFYIPPNHNKASGIKLRFIGMDSQKATALIKKISIFYRKETILLQ